MSGAETPATERKLDSLAVQRFQDRLKDINFRKNLAAYFAVQRALRPDYSHTPDTEEGLIEIAWLAVDDFASLTNAVDADGWPETMKPVEEFHIAAEDMDRKDFGG